MPIPRNKLMIVSDGQLRRLNLGLFMFAPICEALNAGKANHLLTCAMPNVAQGRNVTIDLSQAPSLSTDSFDYHETGTSACLDEELFE